MNEVVLGIKGEPNESAEGKEFRQGIVEEIENASDIAKEKGIKNTVIDFTPEFP